MRVRALGLRFCTHCQVERPFRGRVCIVCRTKEPKASKYGNRPTRDASGAMRHSKLEADHGTVLYAAEQAGSIKDLEAQVRYRLDLYGSGPVERLLEEIEELPALQCSLLRRFAWAVRLSKRHVANYVLDYQYEEADTGRMRYEDPKGQTLGLAWQMFQIKRRLMWLAHGIDVEPVFFVRGRR